METMTYENYEPTPKKVLLGIELTDEEFDFLMCEQNKGKELKVIDNKVIATEKVISEEEKASIRIEELKNWFNTYYTIQEQKLRRLHTLQLLCDDGTTPYYALVDLYNLAEKYRKEIQELEKKV